eukprot:TRINITY_DN16987_c0_g1_i1.p1 TRINITY_DN16987_c0_g1~~TRINITY_DN16987_c0_g1_i1.p1  ORF type:complete len:464 (+),score=78.14 TRINITY_DN16987_c0_g1_i1:82-1392(+)
MAAASLFAHTLVSSCAPPATSALRQPNVRLECPECESCAPQACPEVPCPEVPCAGVPCPVCSPCVPDTPWEQSVVDLTECAPDRGVAPPECRRVPLWDWALLSRDEPSLRRWRAGAVDPQRFLVLDDLDFGGLNNIRHTLINGICLGNLLNRTVVWRGWPARGGGGGQAASEFGYLYDAQELLQRVGARLIRDREWQEPQQGERLTLQKMEDWPGYPKIREWWFAPLANAPHEYVLRQVPDLIRDWSRFTTVELTFPPFYENACTWAERLYLAGAFRIDADARARVDRWIRTHLPQRFAAIHQRGYDGACKRPASEIVAVASGAMAQYGTTALFVASDHQNAERDSLLDSTLPTVRLDNFLDEIYDERHARSDSSWLAVVETYILSRAHVLVFNPISTMSLAAVELMLEDHRDNPRDVHLISMYNVLRNPDHSFVC